MKILPRKRHLAEVETALRRRPVVTLLGPRQCGKSTLARQVAARRKAIYYDLENPDDVARLRHPLRELEQRRGLVVLDEIQRMPELYPVLRVLADRRPVPARFLLLGSAAPTLVRGIAETLAGRTAFVEMSGFGLEEVGPVMWRRLWTRGGFPDSFLARSEAGSLAWREDFIRTFLERDIPQFGLQLAPATLRQLWTMIAHYHGQTWNGAEIGRSLGMAHTTARRHLDVLSGALVVRQLQPWFVNMGKRLVKAPKVYVRDTGLLHVLLRLAGEDDVRRHPKLGASWEGFALEQVLRLTGDRDAYFWATHGGAELDLLLVRHGRHYGFEFKYGDAPGMTKSMHSALADLHLDRLWVIHPGPSTYHLAAGVEAVPLMDVPALLRSQKLWAA
jgi:hypothetical protein